MYGVSKIIPGLAGLLSVVFFMRWVGTETYGQYSLFLAQCNLVAALGFGWLNQALLRYHSRLKKKSLLKPTILTSFFLALGIIFFISIFTQAIRPLTPGDFLLSILCIMAIGAFNIIKVNYQARILPKEVIRLTAMQSVLGLILPLLLVIFLKPSSTGLILGITAAFISVTLLAILKQNVFNNLLAQFRHKVPDVKQVVVKWFKFGYPISVWVAIGLALPFLDRFFINHYLSQEELGAYAGMQELLIRIFSLFLFPITMAIHPKIMNFWNDSNTSAALNMLKTGLLFQFGIFIIILVPLVMFKAAFFNLIQSLVPEISSHFSPLLLPLFITGFLWQLSFLTHKMLEMQEQTRRMVLFILISMGFNFVGNILFIPIHGVVATAYTALFSALAYCLLTAAASVRLILKTY